MDASINSVEVVILAAGKGTRMYSALPKVLHTVGGQPMLGHVIACARSLEAEAIRVVYGHGGEMVPGRFPDSQVHWVLQEEQLGTGHAVLQVLPTIADDALVLVLYGDIPLIQAGTLRDLVANASDNALALLTIELEDPGAYGRIVRDEKGAVQRIVEKKDATPKELAIREINTGFLATPARLLKDWLAMLDNDNTQGEYYLTDIIAMAVDDGVSVVTSQPRFGWEVAGINNLHELALMERTYQMQQAERLLEQGVTLRDPARFDLRGELKAGRDVVIDVNVVMEGKVELGDNVHIGPNCVIRDTTIGSDTRVLPNCVIEESDIGKSCRVGPFARLRPGVKISDSAHIGNFVEVKNSEVGVGSKINHLSYVGDAIVGKGVNIGAGVITANYDGANKHRTVIGDNASIGANNVLVAPVTVGEGATLGAGTVLRKDAPPEKLTLTMSKGRTIEGWKRPQKKVTPKE